MSDNWLWAIFEARMEALTASNLRERTHADWRTHLLRSLRTIAIDLEDRVQNKAVERALTSAGDVPARPAMINLLQKYAKDTGYDWAKEALANFEMENCAAARVPKPKNAKETGCDRAKEAMANHGSSSLTLLHNDLLASAEALAHKYGDGNVPHWLNEVRTLIEQRDDAMPAPAAGVPEEEEPPKVCLTGRRPGRTWLVARLQECLKMMDDNRLSLTQASARGLKRISLALNDGSFDRDYGTAEYDDYIVLQRVLQDAYLQASEGKGKERYANGRPFDQQPIFNISRMVGDGFAIGQAIKKLDESRGMPNPGDAYRELLGAIVYSAAAAALQHERVIDQADEDPFPDEELQHG